MKKANNPKILVELILKWKDRSLNRNKSKKKPMIL